MKKEKRPPTPEEIMAHYEGAGLERIEASLRAISNLQSLFFRVVASRRNANKNSDRKLDNINSRLVLLVMKLDTKPGYPHSFAIGLASGSVISIVSHLSNIWSSVTDSNSSS